MSSISIGINEALIIWFNNFHYIKINEVFLYAKVIAYSLELKLDHNFQY